MENTPHTRERADGMPGMPEMGHLDTGGGQIVGRKWEFYIEISLIPNYPMLNDTKNDRWGHWFYFTF